jgi:hypothetical protein
VFGIEFPAEGTAPKSGDGGSQGLEGRGSCATTLAACNKSRAARDKDGEVGTMEGQSTEIPQRRRCTRADASLRTQVLSDPRPGKNTGDQDQLAATSIDRVGMRFGRRVACN